MVAEIVVGLGLAALSLVGIADAAYFVGVTYRWFAPDARWIPQVCRMDEDTCARIVDTRYGRALGLPNAAFGLAWYAVVLGLAGVVLATGSLPACSVFLTLAAGTVLFSVYLIWALVQQLDVDCPLCYLGHGLNLSILFAIAAGCAL